jgi:hypothetical protein
MPIMKGHDWGNDGRTMVHGRGYTCSGEALMGGYSGGLSGWL